MNNRVGEFRKNLIGYSGWLAIAAMLALLSPWAAARADGLSLEDAESLALEQDPASRVVESRRLALTEQAVAAAQLPDPMLKMGVVGLPTDTFHLGQEAMTQVQLGIVQKFPRGQSRQLASERLTERAEALALGVEDQRLRTLLAVREAWLDVLRQRQLGRINQQAVAVFSDLADITQGYYATGRAQQQDVLRTAVELSKVRERTTRIAMEEDRARARLAAWIGEAAERELEMAWPEIDEPATEQVIRQNLERHPRVRALQQEVTAAQTTVELAEQKYRPGFALDLTYGGRGGTQPDGRSRSDLLSLMLTMDIPLFRGQRQDRMVAASVAETAAAMYARDDVYRRMLSEVSLHAASLRREKQRLELFENDLLPQAAFNAEATFDAYQAAVESLTTLMRARLTEFDLQLEHIHLRADALKTRVRLMYLQGESS